MTETTQFQSVLTFDSQESLVDCGSGIKLANTSFTIEFWVKRKRANIWHLIAHQGDFRKNFKLHIGFRDTNVFTLAFYANDLDTSKTYIDSNWHHWSCVYDYNRRRQIVYRDGIEVDRRQAAPYQGSGAFYLGAIPGFLFFEGQIADMRIWRCARTSRDIRNTMHTRLTGKEKHLSAYWPLDEGEGTMIADKTINGHDGTISGATWTTSNLPLAPLPTPAIAPRPAITPTPPTPTPVPPIQPEEVLGHRPAMQPRTMSVGLEDYAYWWKVVAKQQSEKGKETKRFRRGRIWA